MFAICTTLVTAAVCLSAQVPRDTGDVASGAAAIALPAGTTAERGASAATYGRDSREILFMIWPPARPQLLVSRKGSSGWSTPAAALPDFPNLALGPAVSPDGELLYFESNFRSPEIDGRRDTDLWVARRDGEKWTGARPLGAPFNTEWQEHNVTVSARATICFNSSRPGGTGEHDLYCAARNGEGWDNPLDLGTAVNSIHNEGAAHIDPAENYILFGSDRPGGFGGDDIYISYRRNGQWQPAVNLGPMVNTAAGEWAPAVSPDGKSLLFTRIVGDGNAARFTLLEVPLDKVIELRADSATPPRRAHHALVWDDANSRVLLTGGSTPVNGGNNFVFYNDLWEFDGSGWRKLPSSGAEMSGAALTYDSKRRRVLSFGGYQNGHSIGLLRVLDNNVWRDIMDRSDAPVSEPGFVHDLVRDNFIAFGGSAGRGRADGDTWLLRDTVWSKLAVPRPPARQAHSMVFDEKRGKVVLFGGMGSSAPGQPPPIYGDTWEFDGSRWEQKNVAGPSPRNAAGMTYDSRRGLTVLFGGADSTGFRRDTWSWDGTAWKLLSDSGPPARVMGALAYDRARDRIVMFGGRKGWPNGDLNDTWEWDGSKWSEVSPQPASIR